MAINKLLLICMYILFYIFNKAFCQKLTLMDLKSIVSKKDTIGWLDSLNSTENPVNPYCRLCCITIASQIIGKHCGSHTLCKYPTNNTGPACKGFLHIGFSNLEKETLLDAHNTLRNIVASGAELRGNPGPQPSAANMRALEWNDELAFIAGRWASQCIYSHDLCRDLERFPVGQTMAHGNLTTNNELSFIKAWYDEVKYLNKSEVENFKLPKQGRHPAGKYTQLIWADTYQIGCARAVFQKSRGSQVNYREHLICNYGPTGNIPNQPVYVVGSPCTACHEGTSCLLDYPALCGVETISKLDQEINDLKMENVKIDNELHVKSGINNCKPALIYLLLFYVVYNYYKFLY